MANGWEIEMQAMFDNFQRTFIEEFRKQMLDMEQRLETRLSERLETRLSERLEARLSERLQAQGAQLETRLSARLDERVGHHLRVQTESLRDLVKRAAEGYGGTLEKIERELAEFRQEWREKTADTDRILHNHNGRIVSLEGAVFPDQRR